MSRRMGREPLPSPVSHRSYLASPAFGLARSGRSIFSVPKRGPLFYADFEATELRMMASLGLFRFPCPACGDPLLASARSGRRSMGYPHDLAGSQDDILVQHALKKGDPEHGVLLVMTA